MPVKGLACDAKLGTEFADFGAGLAHGCHGQAELRRAHFVGSAAVAASGPGGGQSGEGSFGDEFAFEFGEGGEDSEDEFSGGCGGVDGGALPGEDLESDAAFGQVVNDVDQVPQVPAEPVELPDHQGVPVPQGFEACRELGSVVFLSGGQVFVERAGVDAGGQERVALQVGGLGSVGL